MFTDYLDFLFQKLLSLFILADFAFPIDSQDL